MLPVKILIVGVSVGLFILSVIDDSFLSWSRLMASPSVFVLVALHRLEVRKKAGPNCGFSIEDFGLVLLGAWNIFYLAFLLAAQAQPSSHSESAS